MAIVILGQSTCVICGNTLVADDDLVMTTAFLSEGHPMWRFSDAAMHRFCFLSWPRRAEFIYYFNYTQNLHNAGILKMRDDGTIEECEPNH
jgi:hypothetical protein